MAKITPSALVTDIKGKIGSVVFSKYKNTITVRKPAISIKNKQNRSLTKRRSDFARFSGSYKNLTTIEKAQWEEYAQGLKNQQPFQAVGTGGLIKSSGGVMSGHNAYVKTNCLLASCWLPPVTTPPVRTVGGVELLELGVKTQMFTQPLSIHLDYSGIEAGDVVRVWEKHAKGSKRVYLYHLTTITQPMIDEQKVLEDQGQYFKNLCKTDEWDPIWCIPPKKDEPMQGAYPHEYDLCEFKLQCDIVTKEGFQSPPSNVVSLTIFAYIQPNIATVWDSTDADFKADFESIAAQMKWKGYPDGLHWFARAIYEYGYKHPEFDHTAGDKEAWELDGVHTNAHDFYDDDMLPGVPEGMTDEMTNNW